MFLRCTAVSAQSLVTVLITVVLYFVVVRDKGKRGSGWVQAATLRDWTSRIYFTIFWSCNNGRKRMRLEKDEEWKSALLKRLGLQTY